MTNLEWLKTLSAEELTEYLRKECLSCTYKDFDCGAEFCFKGHIEWLNAEHIPKIKACPVCHGKMDIRWQHNGCYLVCEDCGMHFGIDTDRAEEGIIEGDYAEEAALVDDWNRRFDDEHE